MSGKRTDLAVEAKEIWTQNTGATTQLQGVEAVDKTVEGFKVTTVRILNEEGEKALNKPIGKYITIDLDEYIKRTDDAFNRGVLALSGELTEILAINDGDTVLVAGLGNSAITPDAIGPKTIRSTMVTRHLVEMAAEQFGSFRPVSAIETGVLGTTGIESGDIIRSMVDKLHPSCVIVVDALASRALSRVCRTVQISDTGIVPGSGVGNSRAAINSQSLGVKVISVGVPTVVDAGTLATDLAEQAGVKPEEMGMFSQLGGGVIVTPKEIDSYMNDISKIVAYGINLALHKNIGIGDVDMFVS